jgi:hypothetical protein
VDGSHQKLDLVCIREGGTATRQLPQGGSIAYQSPARPLPHLHSPLKGRWTFEAPIQQPLHLPTSGTPIPAPSREGVLCTVQLEGRRRRETKPQPQLRS